MIDRLDRLNHSGWFHTLAWVVLGLYLTAVLILKWHRPGWTFDSSLTLLLCNGIFSAGVSIVVVWLAAAEYLKSGRWPVLLMGCAMLLLGGASIGAAILFNRGLSNSGIAFYNIAMCAAGTCHLAGVLQAGRIQPRSWRSGLLLPAAYTACLVALGLLWVLVLHHNFPVFLRPGEGPTVLRQAVLGVAIAQFSFSGILMGVYSRRTGLLFFFWYAMGLGMIAAGLLAISLITVTDGPLIWLGRGGQYLGGIYILLAIVSAYRERKVWELPIEEALVDSEQRFRTLAEASFEGIAISERGLILDCNEQLARMVGRPRRELLGLPIEQLLARDPRDRVLAVLNSGSESIIECDLMRADGQRRSTEVHDRTHGTGLRQQRITVIRDITERKQTEDELRAMRNELEQRIAERTVALTASNHELRLRSRQLARLTSELTLTEQRERRRLAHLLHDELQQLLVGAQYGLEALGRHLTEDHKQALDRVRGLINDSVALSRSLTVELSPPILHDGGLVAGLEWLARSMAAKHDLAVDLDLDPAADTGRDDLRILIYHAVRELLFNIIKHGEVRRAEVRLHRQGDQIQAQVSDDGIGFDPDLLLDSSHHADGGGFGLLSIRERIVWLGGQMEIDSAPGRGTRITLMIPIVPSQAAPPCP